MTIDLATINFIPGQGGGGVIKSLSVTSNGVYSVPAGVDGYNPVDVDVHPSESLQRTYTSNGIYNIPGEYNGVEIEVNTPVPSGVMTITSNGIYDVTSFASASVDVPSPEFITEPLNITSNGTYTPGQGVDGFSTVTVDVPQSVTGYTQKELTEGVCITDLNNSASFVASSAFAGNSCLTTVNLPMCKTIGNSAFQACRSLTSVNLPMCSYIDNNAFQDCSSLTSIDLPMCSYISYNAFQNCSRLTSIDLPMCSYISYNAFQNCSRLTSIDLPMCSYIGNNTFNNCFRLTSIDLPMCNYIGNNTFNNCSSLSEVNIVPYTVGGGCFNNCLISSINLSNIISYTDTFIGGWVEKCSNLSTITLNLNTYLPLIPYNITGLSNGTKFSSGIGSIYVQSWFYDNYISADGWSSLSSLIISVPTASMLSYSDGVVNGMTKYIERDYYSYLDMSSYVLRKNVVSVNLPNCEYINYDIFRYYGSLTSVNLPMCSYISNYAFQYCSSLTSIDLPMCSYIGDNVFNDCSSLSVAYIGTEISTVCVLGNSYAFEGCSALTSIYVPASLVESYKTATNWTYYSDKIVGI